MNPFASNSLLVHHRGALGDSVLLWPLLRALLASGLKVTLATDGSKARLAARFLGIEPLDAEHHTFAKVWRTGSPSAAGVRFNRVIWFGAEPGDRDLLSRNIRALFSADRVDFPSERPDRVTIEAMVRAEGLPTPRIMRRPNPAGPIVLHVGAGSEAKRWPMERWARLAAQLGAAGRAMRVLAGEVEAERFSAADRSLFNGMQGAMLESLDALADELAGAGMVIVADSGPGHLAAQLGVATLSLFGPTDPSRWAPRGPMVEALSPARPSPMGWLEPDAVKDAALRLLGG